MDSSRPEKQTLQTRALKIRLVGIAFVAAAGPTAMHWYRDPNHAFLTPFLAFVLSGSAGSIIALAATLPPKAK
jgi:hypothetical protein